MSNSREETLREAACVGDYESVQTLLAQGVNVNSQNAMNGWTALHWAAKRGHKHIAELLLDFGANAALANTKGETALGLASDPTVIQLLGGSAVEASRAAEELPFTPHYLVHPPINPKVEIRPTTRSHSSNQSDDTKQELVLKVRVANIPDPDFIEVEVPEATFSSLLRVCCDELQVPAQRVTRVRKLPNTILRKDRDVQRLQYLQEVELVLEGGTLFNGEVTKANTYQSISKYKNQTILY